jgi:hypothetical protein
VRRTGAEAARRKIFSLSEKIVHSVELGATRRTFSRVPGRRQ